MDDCRIRRAELRDADDLGRCLDAAYAHYRDRIADLPSMSESCAEEIAEHLVWVAEDGGRIVGALVLMSGDGFMRLANVAVHPDLRGRGLGRRLLTLAETEARDRGFAELRLTTHADMPENIELYTRNGWRREGQQGKKVSMRKTLAD